MPVWKPDKGSWWQLCLPILAIAGFLAGSFAGSWLSHSEYQYARRLLFPVSAGLLALFIIFNFHSSLNANLGLVMLSLAMGLLNPAVSRIGSEPLSLTFVTGTLNKIGGHLALAARRERPADAEGAGDTHLRRALLEAYIWAGFLAGAVFSGLAASRLGRLALVPACAASDRCCFRKSRRRDPLNPLAPPGRCVEGIGEILCLMHDLAVAEFHNAHCVCWSPLVGDGVFRDPEITFSENSLDGETRRLAWMMTPQGLQIPSPEDSFA